jgi:hypothetical protein
MSTDEAPEMDKEEETPEEAARKARNREKSAHVLQLLERLKEKGWTLTNIARAIEVSEDTITKWRSGQRSPVNLKLVIDGLDVLVIKKRHPPKRQKRNDSLPKGRENNKGND